MSVNIKENDALNGIAKLIPASNITLSSLPDTNITLPQAEQSLGYDEASGRWINYNVRISVYYSDDFRGLNISCTKGQTTITKTAPMDGNAVVFYVNEKGTWTVSANIGATEYTDTVVVTSFGVTYPAQLVTSSSQTPEGATVEPTDDIQIWLACANLDKPYTTLDAVLADRETFETLLRDSNACDYMARSTTWAKAEGIVPKMTSNTTPSGECIGSGDGYSSTYSKWMAFNPDEMRGWLNDSTAPYIHVNNYVGYTPTSANRAISCDITLVYYSSANTVVGKIQGNDGTTWTDLTENITVTSNANNTATKVVFTKNIETYTSYRWICVTAPTNNYTYGLKLQFYADADIATNQDAMALIGKYDYCSNALLGNATWAEAIANSDYFESVLNVKVPKMTSNTTPSGECISNVADSSSYYKYYAFDQNTSTAWAGAQSGNSYIGYKFTQQVVVDKAYFKTGNYYGRITSIKVQGSNDNFNSDIHDLSESITPTSDETTINMSSVGSYQYYRLYMSSSAAPIIYEVQFYGRASAQTNIIHSAPNDTIYYMEDGSPVTVATTNSDGDGVLDFSSLEDKEYTFYSSVAKNPSNLSNDFSKTIRITKSEFGGTTEMYLMPDTVSTLYWFGYGEGANDSYWTAGGFRGKTGTASKWTQNTNKMTASMTVSSTEQARTNIVSLDFTNISKVHYISEGSSAYKGEIDVSSVTGNSYLGFSLSLNTVVGQRYNVFAQKSNWSNWYSTGGVVGQLFPDSSVSGNTITGYLYAIWYE